MSRFGVQIYYRRFSADLDYLSLTTPVGDLSNSRMQAQGIEEYVIAFLPPALERASMDASLDAFAHIVSVPVNVIDGMRREDEGRRRQELFDARQAPPLPSHPGGARESKPNRSK